MDLKLDGKTALITGSTAGIGLEIAARLAVEGAEVTICGRSQAKLDHAIAHIAGLSRGRAPRAILADAASSAGAGILIREAPEVDILINNLGIYESKPFQEITDQDWANIFEVNVIGGARLARHYMAHMLAEDWGRIIFVSSESGLVVPPDMIHYAVTKSAQLTISRGLAQLTKGTKVTVNSVMPGPTRSEGIIDFLRSVASNPDAEPAAMEREFFEKHRPLSLIQRMIEPEEIASLVAYLASPLSAATNGAALRVEGGIVPTIA